MLRKLQLLKQIQAVVSVTDLGDNVCLIHLFRKVAINYCAYIKIR